ncbi:MAG: C-GCAxxG-C-C family protein, partial [Oscillospiraceae bacterium]|nr:C-GCAxxG-C-C family protein [Oscillospiraceae bacterium]
GNTGGVCGCLTGGACFIAYFASKGESDELEHPDCNKMIARLREWFEEYTSEYGGCDCRAILAGDEMNKIQRCPLVVRDTLEKCMELLGESGVL